MTVMVARMTNPAILVVGAGPGVGAAVAGRFGRAGWDAALIARSGERLAGLRQRLAEAGTRATAHPADITDPGAVTAAVRAAAEALGGRFDVVHFNPSAFTAKPPSELSADELLADVRLGVAALLDVVRAARPFLPAGARITATGGATADRPWVGAASLGVQKAGLRNLVAALDGELAADGVRAMSLTVNGTIEPGGPFDPGHIADAIFAAAGTDEADWRTEVPFEGLPPGR